MKDDSILAFKKKNCGCRNSNQTKDFTTCKTEKANVIFQKTATPECPDYKCSTSGTARINQNQSLSYSSRKMLLFTD